MELIRIASADYDRYEELLLQYDQLEKEAYFIQEAYIRVFGELNNELFQGKIECIRLKKAIAWCQEKRNRGKQPDRTAMDGYLKVQMAAYRLQLEDMVQAWEKSQKMQPVSPMQVEKVKAIYRRLAKKLHPDINPLTKEDPVLYDLFQRVMIAYRCNDLTELQGLEVLASKALNEISGSSAVVVVDDIEEKIGELETRIGRLTTTEPYTLKEILEDPERVEKKKASIRKEIGEYEEYRKQLAEHLETLL
ncbi:MAG: hypothetical protein Q4G19_00770 [Clostridia bacterium]|nr:hypothetical protein [Clostridia bacterium]